MVNKKCFIFVIHIDWQFCFQLKKIYVTRLVFVMTMTKWLKKTQIQVKIYYFEVLFTTIKFIPEYSTILLWCNNDFCHTIPQNSWYPNTSNSQNRALRHMLGAAELSINPAGMIESCGSWHKINNWHCHYYWLWSEIYHFFGSDMF